MKHLGDITKIDGSTVPKVCVVIGGSPCQDLSVAGKRSGLSGERSGLFMEMIRIIKEMREDDKRNGRTGSDVRPRFMVWENVPGAFSSNKGEDFRIVLEEIVKVVSDCTVIPRPPKNKWRNTGVIMGDGFSVAWRVLDAQFWGVPQRRRRIALVADFGGCTAPEILFERESLSGNSQESGTPWEGAAGKTEKCTNTAVDGVKCLTPWDCQSKRVFDPDGSMCTYQAMGDSRANNVTVCYSFDSLASNSMKSANPHSGCREVEVSKTLDTTAPDPSKNQGGIAIVQPILCLNDQGGKMGVTENIAGCLRAQEHGHQPAICIQGNCIDRADTAGCNGKGWRDDDISFTLNTVDRPAVYDARGNGDGETVPTLTGDHLNRVTDYTAICIGNGQVNQLRVSDKVGALNCMHDQQAIISINRAAFNQGKNACYNINISEDGIAPSQVAKGLSAVCAAVDCRNGTENPDINGTLQSKPNGGMSLNLQNVVREYSIVRRLTPLESERLQGFPDGWTDIGEWTDTNGKSHKNSDSARYKALGNSIALPPWRYVLSGVMEYCAGEKTMASLFDGIGGFPLIWRELGGNTVWASEIEEFPIAVTKKHFN